MLIDLLAAKDITGLTECASVILFLVTEIDPNTDAVKYFSRRP